MTQLFARELALPPAPLEIAGKLVDEPGFAFLWSASGIGPSYVAACPIATSDALDPEPELLPTANGSLLSRTPRWIGMIPYESRRVLERTKAESALDQRALPHVLHPSWLRFGAVACVGERVTVIGDDARCVQRLCARLLAPSLPRKAESSLVLRPSEPAEKHEARVKAALEAIAAGQVYQVNLARRFDLDVAGHPLDLLRSSCRDTRPAYAFASRADGLDVVSTSPELLLEYRADRSLLTSPIKGTRPRGTDAVSDTLLARELDGDPKERAELSMVVDVERNDLGRVCDVGSVRVGPPQVATQGLVWHRRCNVRGRARAGLSRSELLEAIVPSGSVTGAPKIRAMELIAELESERRGLYTGGLGFLSHAGELTLSMAIRTLTVRNGSGHYFSGGGIVADSDPRREVQETLWKARQLFGRAG